MSWQQNIWGMIGNPVGVSLKNGKGTSGVLCDIKNDVLYLIEYMYQDKFAMKQYGFDKISDVMNFPPCPPESNKNVVY